MMSFQQQKPRPSFRPLVRSFSTKQKSNKAMLQGQTALRLCGHGIVSRRLAIEVNRGQRVVWRGGATLAVVDLVGVEGEVEAGGANGLLYMHDVDFLFSKIYASA
jgi:hypothetical protein